MTASSTMTGTVAHIVVGVEKKESLRMKLQVDGYFIKDK